MKSPAAITFLVLAAPCALALNVAHRLPAPALRASRTASVRMMAENDDERDPEIPSSGVDWDAAWKTELKQRADGTSKWRPEGRELPSEAELAGQKLRASADDAQAQLATWSSNWQFWVAILAVISVATALGGHGESQTYAV